MLAEDYHVISRLRGGQDSRTCVSWTKFEVEGIKVHENLDKHMLSLSRLRACPSHSPVLSLSLFHFKSMPLTNRLMELLTITFFLEKITYHLR